MAFKIKIINRIIDANINRLKEGLRVCEEITRFILDSGKLTSAFKKLRHRTEAIIKSSSLNKDLLKARNILKDVGTATHISELKRKDYRDIFFANIQRVKESARVLEEFTKIINKNIAVEFKKLRYDVYELEKKVAEKISSLYHHR